MRSFTCTAVVLMAAGFGAQGVAWANIEEPDSLGAVLIAADLADAEQLMVVFDLDEDGIVDARENQNLSKEEGLGNCDINRNGRITPLEIAIRLAELRAVHGIIAIDRKVAERLHARYDKNKDGKLAAHEPPASWPEDPAQVDRDADGVYSLFEIAIDCASGRKYRSELGITGVDQGGAQKLLIRFDKNHDGQLEDEEHPAAISAMNPKRFDDDKNGTLSITELALMLAKHRIGLGLTCSDQLKAREAIHAADTNRDWVVTPLEFDAAVAGGRPVAHLREYDSNQDGAISLLEIEKNLADKRAAKGYSDQHFQKAGQIVYRNDRNRNSVIELSESKTDEAKGFLSRGDFRQMDKDGDNQVSREEVASYLSGNEL